MYTKDLRKQRVLKKGNPRENNTIWLVKINFDDSPDTSSVLVQSLRNSMVSMVLQPTTRLVNTSCSRHSGSPPLPSAASRRRRRLRLPEWSLTRRCTPTASNTLRPEFNDDDEDEEPVAIDAAAMRLTPVTLNLPT